jgi:NAD+ diphosphatase
VSAVRSGPPLSRARFDRDATARTRAGLWDDLDREGTAVLVLSRGRALLAEQVDGSSPRLALLDPAALADHEPGTRLYLGRTVDDQADVRRGTPIEARMLEDEQAAALVPEDQRWSALRDAVQHLDERDAGLFTEGLALARWHESHRHCPRCGAPLETVQGGWAKLCPGDDGFVFPRTDPAVIVRVIDADDRLLLGSNAMWEQRRFSLLAGFVEPGESLEAAVVREIAEEAGVVVGPPHYLGSQPWPFPASVMLGFEARLPQGADAAEAVPDGEEILELRWFTRDELATAAASGAVLLPGPSSIARWIIEDWFGGEISEPQVNG